MCTTFQTVGNFLAGDLHLKKKKKMNESPDFFFWSSLHIAFLSTHPYKYASVQRQDTELQVFFAKRVLALTAQEFVTNVQNQQLFA